MGVGAAAYHRRVIIPPPRTLTGSGHLAEFEEDKYVQGAVQLLIDGTPQSHVNLDDPSDLFFEYVRRIGHVIDLVRPEREPITALHLGGGAFTLPRYVEATRPGSSQQVIELEGDLVDYVRESFPLPKRAQIRVRRGDAREVVAKLPAGLHGACDVIVVDVFAGARTPAHVTSLEFYRLLAPLLAPGGVIAINVADGPGLPFVRGQLATLSALFPAVAAVAEAQVLKGRRFGNVVIVAGQDPDAWDWLPRLLAGGPHPARMVEGAELRTLIAGAKPVNDETATASPEPARRIFEKR